MGTLSRPMAPVQGLFRPPSCDLDSQARSSASTCWGTELPPGYRNRINWRRFPPQPPSLPRAPSETVVIAWV